MRLSISLSRMIDYALKSKSSCDSPGRSEAFDWISPKAFDSFCLDKRAAASLYVWLGRFRGVRGFRVEVESGELLDSEMVEVGKEDVGEVRGDVNRGLTISRSKPKVLPPPLRKEDIVPVEIEASRGLEFALNYGGNELQLAQPTEAAKPNLELQRFNPN
ncbi:hypothetical protein CDL15_Pgr019679 [Punica granatum]|uniref:Uncharacterized protein n=1 Tax=Punica granatum TaxID=22663 RepID=A0A218X6Q6_PUNGR|nr:hypothetical protein CDL15_Pgr019679 [Punica granatum]PKI52878.1 hypothetical protein CRG98_026709 [Punica granatum]